MYQGSFKDVLRKIGGCFEGVWYFKEVHRVFQGSFMNIFKKRLKVFGGSFKGVSREFPRSPKDVSRKFQSLCKNQVKTALVFLT